MDSQGGNDRYVALGLCHGQFVAMNEFLTQVHFFSTGVPPNFTISEYMMERGAILMDDEEGGEESDDETKESFCCCFAPVEIPVVRIRDPSLLPSEATLLLTRLTEKKPENRMTVREAQMDPWIAGGMNKDDERYDLPQGNIPSYHGDPVVPLDCATELSKFTVQFHMQ